MKKPILPTFSALERILLDVNDAEGVVHCSAEDLEAILLSFDGGTDWSKWLHEEIVEVVACVYKADRAKLDAEDR